MVTYLAAAELRRRWRSVLLLTLLVAVVVGAVLASVAGAGRSRTAFARYLVELNAPDAMAFGDPDALDGLDALPFVESAPSLELAAVSPVGLRDAFFPMVVSAEGLIPEPYLRMPVLRGRRADPTKPLELVVGERTARRLQIDVGDSLAMESWSGLGGESVGDDEGDPEPDGPRFDLQVVGVVREPGDIGSRDSDITLTFLTPAFRDRFDHDAIGDLAGGRFVVLTHPDEITDLTRATADAGIEIDTGLSSDSMSKQIKPTMAAIATALQIFAIVVAVAGLATILHVVGRLQASTAAEDRTMSALGIRGVERAARLASPGVVAVVAGTLIGAPLALTASPLFPVGLARRAEPDPGLRIDLAVTVVGGAAAMVLGIGLVAVLGLRRVRAERAPLTPTPRSRLATTAGELGASAATVAGLSLAASGGRSGRATAGTAIGGAALGVLGVLAAVVVAGSTDRLATTPALYGWGWDANIAGANISDLDDGALDAEVVISDPDVEAAGELIQQLSATVEAMPVPAMVTRDLKGHLEPVIVDGREPSRADELALGRATLDSIDRRVGDRVTVSLTGPKREMLVTGVVALPVNEDGGSSGIGVFMPGAAADALGFSGRCDEDSSCFRNLAITLADGVAMEDVVARYEDATNSVAVDLPSPPAEIERLTAIKSLPWFLAGFLALLAGVAVTYAAATGVRRRRRDLAILRVIGMTSRQLRGVVAVHVLVLSVAGAALGTVGGYALGRLLWRLVVSGLSLPFAPESSVLAAITIPVSMVLISQAAATSSRRTAGRTPAALTLRTE